MTRISMTPAQLARAERNGGQAVEVPGEKPRKAPRRQEPRNSSRIDSKPPEQAGMIGDTVEGIFGSRAHRWQNLARVSGWLTVCGLIQMHGRPGPGRGDEEKCGGCFDGQK